jgi:hypothetical protein
MVATWTFIVLALWLAGLFFWSLDPGTGSELEQMGGYSPPGPNTWLYALGFYLVLGLAFGSYWLES